VSIEADAADWALSVAGEGEAFGRIFDRHYSRVTRHARRLTENAADAEDVAAVTFLEAWRRRQDVRLVDGSVLPWLLVTATNTAHNVRRARRRHHALLERLPAPSSVPDHADDLGDGVAVSAMRSLSLADRQVLTLCVVLGVHDHEAASVLGVPHGTVKSRLSRARRRLSELVRSNTTTHTREGTAHGA